MDALEFIKTAQRYTKSEGHDTFEITKLEPPEEMLKRMEQWAEEHPIRTRQSELLKLFPDTRINEGIIDFCPCYFDPDYYKEHKKDCDDTKCIECLKKFWLGEVDNGT